MGIAKSRGSYKQRLLLALIQQETHVLDRELPDKRQPLTGRAAAYLPFMGALMLSGYYDYISPRHLRR